MGFDFDVVSVRGKRKIATHASGYLSNNFGDLSEKVGWYLPNDLHGRSGRIVARRARDTLKRLAEKGFAVGVPDVNNRNWGWAVSGNSGDSPMPENERIGVLLFHLKRFAEMGEKYPNYYFIADNGCGDGFYDENDKFCEFCDSDEEDDNSKEKNDSQGQDDDDNDSSEEKEYVYTTSFRHPVKGTMTIATFDDAMEIFGLLRAQGDVERAEEWKKLAFTLAGAPSEPPKGLDTGTIRGIYMIRTLKK